MRVIAGELGGRRLKAPAGRVTRPTSDRVREAVFGMLGDVGGASVLDLFAGTGALGIEALSRGAHSAVFVEHDAGVVKVLKGNLAALGISPEAAEVRRADALESLRSAKMDQETYDLVFIDPPYGRARPAPSASGPPIGERWGPELSAILPALLSPGARVVVESDRRAPLELELPSTGTGEPERSRRYGDTSITIHLHQ
ncbi:MAG TPA: 16S rRNA (guanine(966)-N(2))-methyltransferase RsmD [Solirubrobacteraceae bacterium]|jgi:16S rRNA (guanine(966)-N(2))-methyltransferase RsmD|nr:16S rRNA (guanine(966)-N(2))-methyltransferase RsmD [Solirubrobacteraceae bacterium]